MNNHTLNWASFNLSIITAWRCQYHLLLKKHAFLAMKIAEYTTSFKQARLGVGPSPHWPPNAEQTNQCTVGAVLLVINCMRVYVLPNLYDTSAKQWLHVVTLDKGNFFLFSYVVQNQNAPILEIYWSQFRHIGTIEDYMMAIQIQRDLIFHYRKLFS